MPDVPNLPPPGFGGCEHPEAKPSAAVYAIGDPMNPGVVLHSVHLRVTCPHCGAAFRFLGNNALAPSGAVEAQRDRIGAWVSGDAVELACMIAPIEPGEALATIAVAGRA